MNSGSMLKYKTGVEKRRSAHKGKKELMLFGAILKLYCNLLLVTKYMFGSSLSLFSADYLFNKLKLKYKYSSPHSFQ